MERQAEEILAAADNLAGTCRLVAAALAGSRIDPTTRTAVQLIVDMANRIRGDLTC